MRHGDLSFRENLALRTKEREKEKIGEIDGGEEEKEMTGQNEKMFRESVPGGGRG